MTKPGFIVTTSNRLFTDKAAWKSHAAFSAKVLLFEYPSRPSGRSGLLQCASVNMPFSGLSVEATLKMLAQLEVMTHRRTPANSQAFITAFVPSTAGLISSFSSWEKKKGEAKWTT